MRLNIRSLAAVRSTYQEILDEVKRVQPEAVINGIAIEPMIQKRNGRELVVSVRRDPVFGPAITFGEGGNLVEENRDVAVALPPLNSFLVKDMIRSTRISNRLGEFRNMPAVDMNALELVLLRISEMVCELPWITAMEINPLIVDENGVVAVERQHQRGERVADGGSLRPHGDPPLSRRTSSAPGRCRTAPR